MNPSQTVAIVGTGPAGLMAAYELSRTGMNVTVFEKRKSPGRKLLIAGSSGLNISYDCPTEELSTHYQAPPQFFNSIFRQFSREDWIRFVESLGLETFKGTSRRYFVREMKASGLLKAWTEKLKGQGVQFQFSKELTGFEKNSDNPNITLTFNGDDRREFQAAGFFLGGGSWEPDETPLRWPGFFRDKDLSFSDFKSSNVGFEVKWPEALLKEAEGLPLKNIVLTTSKGQKKGELMITHYGLEGTPVYAIGESGEISVDLKPDLSLEEIIDKLSKASKKENLSPMRRVKKYLKLCPGSEALLFHLSSTAEKNDLRLLSRAIKNLKIELLQPRPLQEAISSSGGLDWEEIDQDLMLKKFPGVYCGGEMLNWDAPTGGFLIQGCVSQGFSIARSILRRLGRQN